MRKKTTRQNFIVYNDIAKQYNLNGLVSDVFFFILSYSKQNKKFSYSQYSLSELLKAHNTNINKAINDLKRMDLIYQVESDYDSNSYMASDYLIQFAKNSKRNYYRRYIQTISDLSELKLPHSRQTIFEIIRSFEEEEFPCTRKAIKRLTLYSSQTVGASLKDLTKEGLVIEIKNKGRSRVYKTGDRDEYISRAETIKEQVNAETESSEEGYVSTDEDGYVTTPFSSLLV